MSECAAWNERSNAINTSFVVVVSLFIDEQNRAWFKYSILPWTADLAAILAFVPKTSDYKVSTL